MEGIFQCGPVIQCSKDFFPSYEEPSFRASLNLSSTESDRLLFNPIHEDTESITASRISTEVDETKNKKSPNQTQSKLGGLNL